jgi:hypothetical protein
MSRNLQRRSVTSKSGESWTGKYFDDTAKASKVLTHTTAISFMTCQLLVEEPSPITRHSLLTLSIHAQTTQLYIRIIQNERAYVMRWNAMNAFV